jgi:hypothetical protein
MAKPKHQRSGYEDPQFLSIDLDVRSRRTLAPLVKAWPWSYCPVAGTRFVPRWLIVNPRGIDLTAELAAKDLLQQIGRLRGPARECWKQAYQRVFDIGVRAPGDAVRAFEDVRLTTETIRRIAAVGGQLQVTVYPAELRNKQSSTGRRR